MLPSSCKAGGKLGVATSLFYTPEQPQEGLSMKCMRLGHADLCRGPMDICQLYQFLHRASVRPNIFEPDLARMVYDILWQIKNKAGGLYCEVLF